jgi:hypothetical protein
MRPPYSTLTPTHIYDYAASLLEPYLQWHDYGPKCTVKTLPQVLFYAAGPLCSVFAACRELRTAPRDQVVRDALTALCPDPAPFEQRLNRLFTAQIPQGLRKRPQRVAIDLTLVPPPMVNPTSASKRSTAVRPKVARPTFIPMPRPISCAGASVLPWP